MKSLLVLVCIFIFLSGQAQNEFKIIKGTVLNAETGEPLPFCSIFIQGKTIGTIANQQGQFQLNVSSNFGSDTLTISHVGYKNFYGIVDELASELIIRLQEAVINLSEVSVNERRYTADDIFNLALEKIKNENGYPTNPFRLDGFYREIHTSNSQRTGVLECAVEVYDNSLTKSFKEIVIPQFRKVYDKQKNTDQFIATKDGHNHLLLLLNNGINLIPLAKKHKTSIWKLPLEIEKITYFNDRMVYVLSNVNPRRELRLFIDLEDYSVYKNELILMSEETDHDNYAWKRINTGGEKCGAIRDHQAYEYRKVNGELYPYYSFRRFDFRCYDLTKNIISSQATFSTELLINNVETQNVPNISPDKLKRKKGLINRKEPYDSTYWKYFNDIKSVSKDQQLIEESFSSKPIIGTIAEKTNKLAPLNDNKLLKIGDHSTYAFNRADTLFGSLSINYQCYDVGHYDLDVEIDPQKERLKGSSRITFKMIRSSSQIRLDLYEHLNINSIRLNDQELTYERDLDALYVNFEHPLEAGGTYSIVISYEGRPLDLNFDIWAGAFIWQTDDQNIPFLQSLCQGYGSKGWWPSKNHLSDEPDSASISVTVPDNLVAVSNGVLTKIDSLINEKLTYHWTVSNPINNYNIAVHIGNYKNSVEEYSSRNGKKLALDYFFLKQDQDLAQKKLKMVPKMLEVYEDYFGPYPFWEDGFKLVQSPYPMEHQSCVAVGQNFDDRLILHEAAHEWWGNSVSITDNAHIWINEAFATYAESLYIEETLGYDLGQEYLNVKKEDIQNDHPIVGIEGVNHFHYRIEDKYYKGALMLNTLRHIVSDDELWFETLKSIQEDFRHSFIDTDRLLNYLSEGLKKDYSIFFDQYLRTVNIPVLAVRQVDQGYRFRWENTIKDFIMPLKTDSGVIIPTKEWKTYNLNFTNPSNIKDLESKYLIKVILK
ncbi:M1 family aminopeptidase [Ekhidna sp.]